MKAERLKFENVKLWGETVNIELDVYFETFWFCGEPYPELREIKVIAVTQLNMRHTLGASLIAPVAEQFIRACGDTHDILARAFDQRNDRLVMEGR